MSYGTVQAEKMTTESGYSLGAGNASSFKNRIINGRMEIDQRNAGAAVTSNNNTIYAVDRFSYFTNGSATGTMQQSSTAPTGFTNSLLYTVGSGSASGSTTRAQLIQRIEGYNIADLAWGSASAKSITLSFWVRSSLTGTFGGSLQNSAQDRSYPFTYTISAANTWEQKSVTIAGETTGTWLTTNGTGVQVYWDMGCGSSLTTTAGAWASGDYRGATGTTSVVATTGATFYLTGCQFEVGTVATSFDQRSIGTEYALCQRYYQTSTQNAAFGISSTSAIYLWKAPVTMRARPSVSIGGAGAYSSTSPYYESYPWNTAGTCTGATASATHASVSGGDILVAGTYSASPATNQVLNLFNQYAPDTLPYNANQSYLIISAEL